MKISVAIYFVIFSILFTNRADAYLDPGTGSYLFQILIAGLLGSLFFLKSIIKKMKTFIKHNSYKQSKLENAIKDDENK